MPSFAIMTLGCKVNGFESASYTESLIKKGYQQVEFNMIADVYIINTCSVTNVASSKSRKMIARAKRLNPLAFICVVGCYVQSYLEEVKLLDGIDLLVGSVGKKELVNLIDENYHKEIKEPIIINNKVSVFEDLTIEKFNQTRAYLKIQDGCNQFCSYCIIPIARGKERSLPLTSAIDQARILADNHLEIVLAGIHSGRYGLDIGTNLLTLLKELCKIDKLKRIRISSIEITELDKELIAFIKDNPKIGKNLHIPLQSGSNEILRIMNRPYTFKAFLDNLNYLRSELVDFNISSDIIVGFPSESEELWQESLRNIQECDFSFLHVFPYSARSFTKAEQLISKNTASEKKQRVKTLIAYSDVQLNKYLQKFLNKKVEIIVEKNQDGFSFGHTMEYLPANVMGDYPQNTILSAEVYDIIDNILQVRV
ncbi:MAG: tRNA (N(6)-L-threonylcarbamoyladenosine(37)-C(2))-methylthiotransferase MtaB [Erysipelotrichaceae bacterium]